jgi:hypothetical protein
MSDYFSQDIAHKYSVMKQMLRHSFLIYKIWPAPQKNVGREQRGKELFQHQNWIYKKNSDKF